MQIPDEAPPANAPVQAQAALPSRDSRPPDHETGKGYEQHGERAYTIHFATGGTRKQIIM